MVLSTYCGGESQHARVGRKQRKVAPSRCSGLTALEQTPRSDSIGNGEDGEDGYLQEGSDE